MEDLGTALGVPNAKMISRVGDQSYPNKRKPGEKSEKKKKKSRRKIFKPALKVDISNSNISTSKKDSERKAPDEQKIGSHIDVKI